jgi:phosphoribosylamine--glycine ligase
VLEFNGRFGDPEAQPLLMRLKTDLVEIMEAVIDERLDQVRLEIDPRAAVCVVMASGGYPGKYTKGYSIEGLDRAGRMRDVMVFHAGTALKDGAVVTGGGRVLGVTALGDSIGKAIQKAYQAVGKISWNNVQYRKDIGGKALVRFQTPNSRSTMIRSRAAKASFTVWHTITPLPAANPSAFTTRGAPLAST